MDSILIKDTTREERERIVAESVGDVSGSCDGCMAGLILTEKRRFVRSTWNSVRDMNLELKALKGESAHT